MFCNKIKPVYKQLLAQVIKTEMKVVVLFHWSQKCMYFTVQTVAMNLSSKGLGYIHAKQVHAF